LSKLLATTGIEANLPFRCRSKEDYQADADFVEQTLAIFVQSRENSMSTAMTVPVTIATEAGAFIDAVGQRQEFESVVANRASPSRCGNEYFHPKNEATPISPPLL
jgi:hypothetical protein